MKLDISALRPELPERCDLESISSITWLPRPLIFRSVVFGENEIEAVSREEIAVPGGPLGILNHLLGLSLARKQVSGTLEVMRIVDMNIHHEVSVRHRQRLHLVEIRPNNGSSRFVKAKAVIQYGGTELTIAEIRATVRY